MSKSSTQQRLLIPFAIVLLSLYLLVVVILKVSLSFNVKEQANQSMLDYRNELLAAFNSEAQVLHSLQSLLLKFPGLHSALLAEDRKRLLSIYRASFAQLAENQGITHFYLHSSSLVNILRLHDPMRFGDKIDRFTANQAATTGRFSSGFELGILGTYTMRIVAPITLHGDVIGYIELGKEIEDIIEHTADTHDIKWLITINKSYLSKESWAKGLQVLDRQGDWNTLRHLAISSTSFDQIPPQWLTIIGEKHHKGLETVVLPEFENKRWRLGALPLVDVQEQNVGHLYLFVDAEKYELLINSRHNWVMFIFASLVLVLFFLMNWFLRKADVQIHKHQEQLRHQASHDELTKLPNRKLFRERMLHAIDVAKRHNRKLAVLFFDLDNFKHTNDSLGHDVGDQVLITFTRKVSEVIRKEDTFARNSGDEFTLLMENIDSEHDCIALIKKIFAVLEEPLKRNEHSLQITTSIGVAIFPQDGHDVETIINNADRAMYQAKAETKFSYYFYCTELDQKSNRRIAIERRLRHALDFDELSLVFQPKFDSREVKLIGMEALLRWHDDELGQVAPIEFVTVAEHTGQIGELGEWVLENTCKQVAAWYEKGFEIGRVSVNVSGRQLEKALLDVKIHDLLSAYKFPASCLELEVTESVMMENLSHSISQLRKIQSQGIHISIDDFGTGYSSLALLKELPINTLKIDRSFICNLPEDVGDGVITKTIIAMAGQLQLEIIAEGVETLEQEEFLFQNGCFFVQGYRYGKPMTADEIEQKYLMPPNRVTT